MQINWFTVIAQVFNFLILVWLLRRFLYKPILNAIDERESKITSKLAEAESKKEDAKKEQADFVYKNELFDRKKAKLMTNLQIEVKQKKRKLLEEARSDAQALRTKLEDIYKEMHKSAKNEIAYKAQKEIFAIARRILNDLASVSLEEQVMDVFLHQLKNLGDQELRQFTDAIKADDTPILVESSFQLLDERQIHIIRTINEILGCEAKFQFKTTPKLISGIELSKGGYKLAWSVSQYLNTLESTINKTISEQSKAMADQA